ncbi:MAG: hypothetical protein CL938_13875 [Deltaproteobacteria bacterium]|jgi:hypothetical protein|nr:hypothetical protein [Deltaproteobacteria bacterium]|tara:strand:- start:1056 stop:1247 length:192 start_codon:yes stop_codon:yes gene_type:complete
MVGWVFPPSGKRVVYDEVILLQLKDGKVARQRGLSDNLTAACQLGILSTPPAYSKGKPPSQAL